VFIIAKKYFIIKPTFHITMSEVQPLQIFAEVAFYAQKRLKSAKLLKNIEVSSKML